MEEKRIIIPMKEIRRDFLIRKWWINEEADQKERPNKNAPTSFVALKIRI